MTTLTIRATSVSRDIFLFWRSIVIRVGLAVSAEMVGIAHLTIITRNYVKLQVVAASVGSRYVRHGNNTNTFFHYYLSSFSTIK